MHPRERIVAGWTIHSGTIYKVDVEHFVYRVIWNGVELSRETSTTLGSNEFYYDAQAGVLYVEVGASPANLFTTVEYRKFYSKRPLVLPYDLASGEDVEYEGLIKGVSNFSSEIDPIDLTGIALKGSGSVTFIKSDHFRQIVQGLYWKGTAIDIYLWFPNTAITQAKIIYRGSIEDKAYNTSDLQFRIKDFVEVLSNEIPLNLYTSADGEITNEGTPKRRIYGRAKVLGVSLDKVKDGFALAGTFTRSGASTVTGTGSSLLAELTPQDKITFTYEGEEYKYTVKAVTSDTVFTTTEDIDEPFISLTIYNDPEIPYRGRNREYFIADHECREPTTTIATVIDLRRITVVDISDFEAGDAITVDGTPRFISRINSATSQITFTSNLGTLSSIGDTVRKLPIQDAYYDSKKLVYERDYTFTNSTDLRAQLTTTAEFNLAPEYLTGQNVGFTNGSRTVTGANFQAIFKPRDWIRNSEDLTHQTWYEILSIDSETSLTLRIAYAGVTDAVTQAEKKSPKHIDDDSHIAFDTLGKTTGIKTDPWIKTGAGVVRDLLEEQGLLAQLDTTTFDAAKIEAPYLISLMLPIEINGNRPKVSEAIELINKSVLGSLHTNNLFEIVYNVLTPKKGEITDVYRIDDFDSFKIEIDEKNLKKRITSQYRFEDSDRFTKEPTKSTLEKVNDFIEGIGDLKTEENFELRLWFEDEASIMTNRISLLRESPTVKIDLKSNSLFMNKEINQVIYIELDDLFYRQGTESRNFLGIISRISKSDTTTEIEITDLGGFYNKVACIAKSGTPTYTISSTLERANYGYITDSNGIQGSDNKTYRLNLIG